MGAGEHDVAVPLRGLRFLAHAPMVSGTTLLACTHWWCVFVSCLVYVVGTPCLLHRLSLSLHGRPLWLFGTSIESASLVALDAETGDVRWTFEAPSFSRPAAAGDERFLQQRLWNRWFDDGGDPFCLPDSWSQAVISADGTVFVGYQDGSLFAIRDDNGDGRIDREEEVSSLDA